MKRFEIGEVYEVKYKSVKRWGEVAGELEIVDIRRIDNPEFKRTSIRDCFEAHAGEIDYIVRSGSTNEKVKTSNLIQSSYSESFANEFCNGVRECEWFSPLKSNYQTVSTR